MTTPSRVLLIHGLTGVPAEMQSIARGLRRAGFEVETPLLPGHGVDEATLMKTGWRDWVGGAEAELLRMTADGSKAFVGGLSVGAVIAIALAERHPDRVAGVLSLAATFRYDGWSVNKLIVISPLFRHVPFVNQVRFKEHPPYGIKDERLRAVVAEMLFSDNVKDVGLPSTPGISLVESLDLVKRVERDLAKVTSPVLVAHAIEDDITHIRNAERLAARVSGPVRKLYLDDCYHLITVDRQRGKVMQGVVDFCRDVVNGVDVTLASQGLKSAVDSPSTS
jgi:carboxylesterase